MIAQVEVTEDDKNFRIIKIEISKVSEDEGRRCMKLASRQMNDDEYIYQICAPCKGCKLNQPFYDFFNGFTLLEHDMWRK